MKALAYLLVIQLKNRILSLKKKPAYLILYGMIAMMFLIYVFSSIFENDNRRITNYVDERYVFLFLAAFGIFYFTLFVHTGLSTGSTLFSMSDVGLLFVAPISTKKILFYGLISTLGKSMIASVFVIYQIGNLRTYFGYGFMEILAIFIIYTVMTLFCQLISIGVYIYSNGNTFRKTMVKIILYSLIGLLALSVLYQQRISQPGVMEAVLQTINSRWFGYFPVAGWSTMFFQGVVTGNLSSVLIAIALFGCVGIVIISLLTVGKADYYEDVLISTEVTDRMKKAAKDGMKVTDRRARKIKIKDSDTGIRRGKGAIILAYKHLLELKRTSRVPFIDGYTIVITIIVGVIGYNLKVKATVYGILGFLVYIQYFLTVFGKLKQELTKPYIYLIPEKSIKKVLAASVTSLLKPCVDGICIFVVFALVGGTDLFTGIFCALAYASSGAVFVGLTILSQRILGGQPGRLIQIFIGITLIFVVMAPAIALAVAAAFLLPDYLQFLCTLPFSVFCILVAALIFVTCGNLIDKSEYAGK